MGAEESHGTQVGEEMARDEILKMGAGRELDILIATMLMGLVKCQNQCHGKDFDVPCYAQASSPTMGGELKSYSTDISDTWEVVDKLKKEWIVTITIDQFETSVHLGKNYASKAIEINIEGDTTPLAICRAALIATMEFKKKES